MKRLEAIDREARRLVNEFAVNRQATLVTQERSDDPTFRHDVIARVRQILAGDDLPITHLNPDD